MSNWVYIEVEEIVAETEKAFLLRMEDGEEWIPKAQIEGGGEGYEKGDVDVGMSITEWIAKQKGMGD